MTTNISQPSAEILQFPTARVRRAAQAHHNELAADAGATHVYESGFGSWYHEEAIAEAKRNREH
jgi:hypothetical protein